MSGKPIYIEVPEFLTTFFKISSTAKGMTGKRDSALLLKEYREALKARLAQQEQVRRTLKAMRDCPPKRPFTVDSGLARAKGKGKWGGCPHNGHVDIATQIRTRIAAAQGTYRLDLSTWADRKRGNFLLSRVPRVVYRLKFLTALWLTNNNLKVLPTQIKELKKLRTLGVGKNYITRFPAELGTLPDLRHIYAEKNWLSSLPAELANCKGLKELRLDNNQFSRLPNCITELRGLEVLSLQGNSIEVLPSDLKYLRSLLDLDLDNNPIGPEVPEPILLLVNLARLSLVGTRIGCESGSILEEKLRLDTLSMNSAVPSSLSPMLGEEEKH
ncbi:unnamed protein product, partial [Choristocarpus tenellus]